MTAQKVHTGGDAAERVISRCRELACYTEAEGEITRPFLVESMHRVHHAVSEWMRDAGMQVHVDPAGNLRGLLPGPTPDSPRLLIGSHLDTVANAGAFDGVLGVALGIEVVEQCAATGGLPFATEVIGFSEEEGVRFGKPFLGSLAILGELDPDSLELMDSNGVTVAQAIRDFGLNPEDIDAARMDPSSCAYVEFHIEQGPVLEDAGLQLGVVEAIAGQTRMHFTFVGHSNHAGTTPMGRLRRDALAAAAEWVVVVEEYAENTPGLVATVGKVEVPSGAGNVIPGKCIATLDVRHARDEVREAAVARLTAAANDIASKRNVIVTSAASLKQPAVPLNPTLCDLLTECAEHATRIPPRRMVSGAGHDAMIVANHLPTGMVFLRSPGGISHHPEEAVLPADVEAALLTGTQFLRKFDPRKLQFGHPRSSKETHA